MRIPRGFQVLVLGAMLLLCAAAQAQEKPKGTLLKRADLEQLIGIAVILEAKNQNTGTWNSFVLGRDGWALNQYVFASGNAGQVRGTWKFEGDALCWKFVGIPLGEVCREHYRIGDNAYEMWEVNGGKTVATYRVRRLE